MMRMILSLVCLDVEEDVIESLKDDLEMMKEKFYENYGVVAEELSRY